MERAHEFRAIEEALTGALKFFDTRPSAQDAQRFLALCDTAAARAAAALAAAEAPYDATLDTTTPMLAAHFHGQGRLAALVLGPFARVWSS